MALLDFLFEGKPPPSVSSSVSTQTNMPDWWQDYTRGLMSKANAIAAAPFSAYTGARVAGTPQDTTDAYGMVRSGVGTGSSAVGTGVDLSRTAGSAPGAMSAAAPYMADAARTFPDAVNDYMSPFTANVVDEIARRGGRNFSENIMPALESTFVGAGQFGSGRNAEFLARAARDTNESILGEQRKALESGYSTAGQLFNQDAGRMGALAQTAGGLTDADRARQAAIGTSLGALGQTQQQMALKDAAALEGVGQAEQAQTQKNLDVGYQDFITERDWPQQQAQFMNQIIRGLNPPTSTTQTSTGPGNSFQPSPLAQVAGATVGASALKNVLNAKRGGYIAPRRYADGGSVTENPDPRNRIFRSQEDKGDAIANLIREIMAGQARLSDGQDDGRMFGRTRGDVYARPPQNRPAQRRYEGGGYVVPPENLAAYRRAVPGYRHGVGGLGMMRTGG